MKDSLSRYKYLTALKFGDFRWMNHPIAENCATYFLSCLDSYLSFEINYGEALLFLWHDVLTIFFLRIQYVVHAIVAWIFKLVHEKSCGNRMFQKIFQPIVWLKINRYHLNGRNETGAAKFRTFHFWIERSINSYHHIPGINWKHFKLICGH